MSENDAAQPEYATAKTAVWWDMNDCLIPEGYDAGLVRPSLEGDSGPVSITAYGDQTQAPAHILRGLSSTGVTLANTIFDCQRRQRIEIFERDKTLEEILDLQRKSGQIVTLA